MLYYKEVKIHANTTNIKTKYKLKQKERVKAGKLGAGANSVSFAGTEPGVKESNETGQHD